MEDDTTIYFARKPEYINVYHDGKIVKTCRVIEKTRHEENTDEPIELFLENDPVRLKAQQELEKIKQRRKEKRDSLLSVMPSNFRED